MRGRRPACYAYTRYQPMHDLDIARSPCPQALGTALLANACRVIGPILALNQQMRIRHAYTMRAHAKPGRCAPSTAPTALHKIGIYSSTVDGYTSYENLTVADGYYFFVRFCIPSIIYPCPVSIRNCQVFVLFSSTLDLFMESTACTYPL